VGRGQTACSRGGSPAAAPPRRRLRLAAKGLFQNRFLFDEVVCHGLQAVIIGSETASKPAGVMGAPGAVAVLRHSGTVVPSAAPGKPRG